MRPYFSVITPSFNQAEFLPKTLASVAAQTHAPIEHIVYDPGSTDGSRDIAKSAPGVTLVAEPDKGQADAVARGMREAKGDIIAWINSDDEYFGADVFGEVAQAFDSAEKPDIVFGRGVYIGRDGDYLRDAHILGDVGELNFKLAEEVGILQPSTFISRTLIDRIGPVDPDYHFCMDYEFWIRAMKSGAKFKFLDRNLSKARYYADNKTASLRRDSYLEVIGMLKKHFGFAHLSWIRRLADYDINQNDGVLKHGHNTEIDRELLIQTSFDYNARVNGDVATLELLNRDRSKTELIGPTRLVSKSTLAQNAKSYSRKIAPETSPATDEKTYTIGPHTWAFRKQWLDLEFARSDALFDRLKDNRSSDTCVLLGNGPSLKHVSPTDIEGTDVFISNYAFLNRKIAKIAKYLCVTNYLVAEQGSERFNLENETIKFYPYWLSYALLPTPNSCLIRSIGYKEFGTNFRENISWRSTVTFFAMQLAYCLGYQKVLMAGFDHSYIQPDLKEGEIIDQKEEDDNHFDPRYFKGRKWQAADTDNMEEMYRLAKAAFENDGREIVNCTSGGQLELFRRSSFEVELPPFSASRKTSITSAQNEQFFVDALVNGLPADLRGDIFLPTNRMPLEKQILGLRRTTEIYSGLLDEVYRPEIRRIKEARQAKRCFIVGNGPSLNRTDLSLLDEEDVFVTNGFFLKMKELRWTPKYYVVEDHLVAEDRSTEINQIKGIHKLFPASLRYTLARDEFTIFFDHRPRRFSKSFDFSFDADKNTFAGGTVTFTCMQLAAYMGYEEIYLIGVDADYAIPKDAEISGPGRVKEIDMQSDDPNHFHPDYFGKGKRWHEPNVDVMIEAYKEARRATEARGVKIINATVGGKLEVFPRADYSSLFDEKIRKPRTLVLDMTRIGDGTATGELKKSLLDHWPDGTLMQVYAVGAGKLGLLQNGAAANAEPDAINRAIDDYKPEVILYRPIPKTGHLHDFAMATIRRLDAPLVTWIMDDWPAVYPTEDADAAAKLDADWRSLIEKSHARLSICEAMSAAFAKRYGVDFTAVANGIDPRDWPAPKKREVSGPFKLRYAGSLAENMTLDTVAQVARAVEALAEEGVPISFEIKTRRLWHERAGDRFKGLQYTSFVFLDLEADEYREWLASADIVIIGYNFDTASKNYIRYSLANKLPECLASGAALVAVGPEDVATIGWLKDHKCGVTLTTECREDIMAALKELAASPDKRLEVAARGQEVAFAELNIQGQRAKLSGVLAQTAEIAPSLPREKKAAVDETKVVAHMLAAHKGREHVLVDVGAHFGTSAGYFTDLGWSVHCFEPDPKNRERLVAKHGEKSNVIIDPRGVSDKPARGVSFFTSDESTGISGLSAFRDTHKESAKVDLTTVADIVRERGIKSVDFLKIDVEGFDFSVLKGVPWEALKPDVIECEFEDAKTVPLGHRWQEIADYLRARGYTVYVSEWHPIVRYGVPHDWRRVIPYPGAPVPENAWGNLLAFRVDPGYQKVREAFEACLKFRAEGKPAPAPQKTVSSKPMSKADPQTTPDAGQSTSGSAYVSAAHGLHRFSPRAYGVVRIGVRALRHIWARRVWTLPAMLVLVLIGAAPFHPAVDIPPRVYLAFYSAIVFTGMVAYAIMRLYNLIERLSDENRQLSASIAAGKSMAKRGDEAILARLTSEQGVSGKVNQLQGELAKVSVVRQEVSAIRANVADAEKRNHAELDKLRGELTANTNTLAARISEADDQNHAELEKTAKELANLRSELGEMNQRYGGFDEVISRLDARTMKLMKTPAAPNNAALFQFFNRQLTTEHAKEFQEEWRKRLSVNVSRQSLGYMANRVVELENRLHGRLATSVEDIILRTLVAKSVRRSELDILEIGTLFGGGAAIMYDAIAAHFEEVRLTLLDPLDGYYNSASADILTGEPVNEKVLRRNLALAGVPSRCLRLIKEMSTEQSAIDMANDREYDVLVIDGDHSYAGVKADFDNYLPMVRRGGFVIIDDYGSEDWPDVTRFVDDEAHQAGGLAHVGTGWRTAVFRVTSKAAKRGDRAADAQAAE